VGLGWMSDGRYLKLRRIDDFGRIEDVTEGFSASASVGVARGFGVTSDLLYPSFGGSVSQVSAWGEHLLVANGSGSVNLTDDRSKNRNGWSSGRLSGFVHYYYLGLPWQTAAASVRYVGLYRPLRPAQLFLGGDVGLRGYPAWQFTGTKALLVNLEDRVFTPLKLYTFAMGLVLFADGGYVWPEGEELSARDIHASVGIGIRIGATKAATGRISRLDLAFPLRDGFGFSLTFGSDQVFNIMGIPAR
ncbi:MAG: BamA/TamA family outer membrane protein, partial [Candidatus Latescibacteria bacterium]|nr:BamA/TamA family outer membrane protein [Candidatus Latescibacterota bacterium]